MFARRARIVLVTVVLLLAGCGDKGSDSGGSSSDTGGTSDTEATTPATSEPTPSPAAEGCDEAHPNRAERPGDLEGAFIACLSGDELSLQVTNTSHAFVLVVTRDPQSDTGIVVTTPEDSSFAGVAVTDTVPSGCEQRSPGPCLLVPGASLEADGTAPVHVSVDIDPLGTTAASSAHAVASYVESKLGNRALGYRGSVAACAKSVGAGAREHQYVDDAIRTAYDSVSDCGSLLRQVGNDLRGQPPAAADATAETLRLAGGFRKSFRRDLSILAAIRIAGKLIH